MSRADDVLNEMQNKKSSQKSRADEVLEEMTGKSAQNSKDVWNANGMNDIFNNFSANKYEKKNGAMIYKYDDPLADEVTKVDDEYINKYIQNMQSYANSAQGMYTDALNNALTGDVSGFVDTEGDATWQLQKQTDAIKRYLEENPDAYGSNRQSLMDFVTSSGEMVSNYRDIISNLEDENWVKSYREETEYQKNWGGVSAEERQKRYEDNQKRIDELTKNGMLLDWFLTDEEKAEVEKLRAENQAYENGNKGTSKVVDFYSNLAKQPDFDKIAANRGEIPTKEEIAKFDAMNDQTTWSYDANGVAHDAFGNELATDQYGNLYNPHAQQSPVSDRLGLYLSATDEEIKDYMSTLSSDVWAGVISDATDGSWGQLTEDEIKIYYYLRNTEGQEAADKYLADMKPELNRRETIANTEKWGKEYDNANILKKLKMNAETIPANLFSGVAGFIDNTAKAVSGNEINPYDLIHGGARYTDTVRAKTAEDLDKTNFKIPLVDFTLGDIYQTTMSRIDSALATTIAGPAGTALLGMQAAEREAYKLYQQGASDAQITAGALLAGAAEMVWEYVSFDQLEKMKSQDIATISKRVKSILAQGLGEAREESLTTVTNLITNALVMGTKSDLAEMYKENKDKAFGMFNDVVQEITHDALGGFIGGVGAGVGGVATNYIKNNADYKAAARYNEVQTRKAVQAKLEAMGETEGTQAVAEAIAKKLNGEKLTMADEMLIDGSVYGNQLLKQIESGNANSVVSVDTGMPKSYNKENKVYNEGVMNDGQRLQQNDRAGSIGNSAQGMAGLQQGYGEAFGRGEKHGGVVVDSGVVRVSKELAEAQSKRGTPVYPVVNTTAEPNSFEQALIDGRNSDPNNGWCVTPKSAEELRSDNVRTFMNESRTTGFGIAQNGDIVAVFKNRNGGPKRALDTMMPIAIEQGGDRLDCYGDGLVDVYSQYGFVPVARVEFNPEYANDGWTPDKGSPYIYFMVHNGDPASVVAEKKGTYPQFTEEQLDALPTYGKDDYDAAMQYRDSLLDNKKAPETVQQQAVETKQDSNLPETAVGAAKQDFTGKAGYYDLLSDENSQPDRPGDVRPMEVLKTDPYGRRVTEFAANAFGAEVTSDEMADRIQEMIYDGALGFDTKTNKQLLDQAAKEIKEDGLAKSRDKVTRATFSGKTRESDIAKAMLLYNIYVSRGNPSDIENASEIMVDLSTVANETGRKLQLFSVFRKMSPEGQLSTVEKSVERAIDKINKKRNDKNKADKFDIPNELKTAYIEAARRDSYERSEESAEAKAIAEREIYKAAAASVKSTLGEKLQAWRYMAMLGNVKTQARNVFGNAIMRPLVSTKRAIGAGLEAIFLDKENRTKAVLGVGKNARELMQWAAEDSKTTNAQELMSYSARTGDTAATAIEQERAVYDWQWLETLRKFTKAVPEAADGLFKTQEYTMSLASFMKARGYTAEDLKSGKVPQNVISEGRSYAANEALKATFNDVNELSSALSKRYQGNSAALKALNAVAEGVLPFRKTPANIVVRAVEYSPVGIASAVWDAATKLKSGKTTGAKVIDKMASGLTGSAAMALGYALAKGLLGVRLRGRVDEEEELAGHKSYSLEIGDKSYDISWAAPAVIPLFVGANMVEYGADAEVSDMANFLSASALSLEPMLELSCLSSLNDIVESTKYAEEGTALYTIMANGATSYLTQYIPTLFGQFEQVTEGTKNKVYTTADTAAGRTIETAIGRMTQRIPGVDLFQAERVDEWGETEPERTATEKIFGAFVSPWGYVTEIDDSKLTQEITRLQESTGSGAVAPSTPDKKLSYTNSKGEKVKDYTLSADEWSQMAKKQGQTQKELAEKVISSDLYKNLPDEYKAEAIEKVYTYAREMARLDVIKDYTVSTTNNWTLAAQDDPVNAILLKAATDSIIDGLVPEDGYDKPRTVQKVEAITSADELLSQEEQADALRDLLTDGMAKRYDAFMSTTYEVNKVKKTTTNDDFAKVYAIYTKDKDSQDYGKDDAIKEIMREFGITKSQARKLYEVYTEDLDK